MSIISQTKKQQQQLWEAHVWDCFTDAYGCMTVHVVTPPVNTNALARPLAHLAAGSTQILVTRWGLSST